MSIIKYLGGTPNGGLSTSNNVPEISAKTSFMDYANSGKREGAVADICKEFGVTFADIPTEADVATAAKLAEELGKGAINAKAVLRYSEKIAKSSVTIAESKEGITKVLGDASVKVQKSQGNTAVSLAKVKSDNLLNANRVQVLLAQLGIETGHKANGQSQGFQHKVIELREFYRQKASIARDESRMKLTGIRGKAQQVRGMMAYRQKVNAEDDVIDV
jgi:hypothetical protein